MTRFSRAVRHQVSQRANHRCEYCGLPDVFSFQPYQIDHIRALKHGGSDDLNNLAWTCPNCNNNKGSDQGSYDMDTGEFSLLFNPRTQKWVDHFDIAEGIIVGKTAAGRTTIALLQMNHLEQVEVRRLLMENGSWD